MNKIIILSRVSTGQQSLSSQTNELIQSAIKLGYPKESHIVLENVESAIKLSEEERKGLQRLKYHIENDSSVDCVICWEPSRLSRRQSVLYSIRDYLLNHKIQLYILNPFVKLLTDDRSQIDTTASIVFSLFATISENEMNIKKERFIRAKNELRSQGKKNAGSTIFGYFKNKDKYIEIHPTHGQIVVDIFNHYANEKDASLYATYLWISGKYPDLFPILPYKKAQRKIKRILDTAQYWEGNWCYPKIVSKELRDKVEAKMKVARCVPRYESKHNWLGRGKVYCGHCLKALTPVAGKVKAYTCPTDKTHNVTINTEAIEWLLWEEAKNIANIKSSIDNSNVIIDTQKSIEEKTNLINQYNNKVKNNEAKQEKLLNLYLEGKITKEIFDKQNEILLEENKIDKNKINTINSEINELGSIINNSQDVSKIKPVNFDYIDTFETKLEIIKDCIDKLWVDKIENKVYELRFDYKGVVVAQKGLYKYISRNHFKRIYRINEDMSEDLIYEETGRH